MQSMPVIAVLGPNGSLSADANDKTAQLLGEALSRAGYTTMVSGLSGTAKAAVDGAKDSGSAIIVSLPGEALINNRNIQQIQASSPLNALDQILDHSDAVILLSGDLTAITILTQIWAYGHLRESPFRQIVLLGPEWKEIVRAISAAAAMEQSSVSMLTYADSVEEAVEALRYFGVVRRVSDQAS